jgi:hypothetical protein
MFENVFEETRNPKKKEKTVNIGDHVKTSLLFVE